MKYIYSCEGEKTQETECFLDRVDEVNNIFGELLGLNERSFRADRRVDSLSKQGVGELSLGKSGLAVLISVLGAFNETDFVVPPAEVTPISF